jgi:hypothetical protein
MYTVISSPTHVLPVETDATTYKDDVTDAFEFRRKLTRVLKRWEIVTPGTQEGLDELSGFLDLIHGDTPFWFDGAGTVEVTTPILIHMGNGVITDIRLPHRNVTVASTVIYQNGVATSDWQPLGGDGVHMDMIRMTSAPGLYAQIKAKYRRKCKVVLETESGISRERVFRDVSDARKNAVMVKYFLAEVPN